MNQETKVQRKIVAELKKRGYNVYRQAYSQRAGTPDLIACSPNGIFCGFEVKTATGKPTALQLHHLEMINKAGGIGSIIRSVDDLPTPGLLSLKAATIGDSA